MPTPGRRGLIYGPKKGDRRAYSTWRTVPLPEQMGGTQEQLRATRRPPPHEAVAQGQKAAGTGASDRKPFEVSSRK